jgi:hypothetical protein
MSVDIYPDYTDVYPIHDWGHSKGVPVLNLANGNWGRLADFLDIPLSWDGKIRTEDLMLKVTNKNFVSLTCSPVRDGNVITMGIGLEQAEYYRTALIEMCEWAMRRHIPHIIWC